ncbi:MAG TPA: hypothetical protein VFD33_02310, partial [Bacillota bacterium]|nr:hypothetical protein [Bacillota bacterium]
MDEINGNQIEILERQINQYKDEIKEIHEKNDEYFRIMDNLSIIINRKLCDGYSKDRKDKTNLDEFVKKEDLAIIQDALIRAQEEIGKLKAQLD